MRWIRSPLSATPPVCEGSDGRQRRSGVQGVATNPAHRRVGTARAIVNALAEEALRRDANRMYLAVMADNDPASALYASAGFRVVHQYSYFAGETH